MKLTIFEFVPQKDGIPYDGERTTITDAQRDVALSTMRDRLAGRAIGPDPFEFSITAADEEPLTVVLRRFGRAASAVWSVGADPVAASIQLIGNDGKDHAAALDSVRNHQPAFSLPPDAYNSAFARERPSLAMLFMDPEWMRNGQIELFSTALLFALLSPPSSSPKMSLQEPPTPEQAIELQRQAGQVAEVFQIIHNDWARRRTLLYTVRPSESVKGRPISEIMDVKFWVGVQGNGMELNIEQTAAVFELLRDQVQQLPGIKHLKDPTVTSTVKLKHEPAELAALISQIKMTEPGETMDEDGHMVLEDPFGLTNDRVNYVASLVGRRFTELGGTPGLTYKVYPPPEYLAAPASLDEPGVYDRFKDTVWWVRWKNDSYDQLRFIELLIFVQQQIVTQQSLGEATKQMRHQSTHRSSKHAGGWQPKKDRSRKPKKPQPNVSITTKSTFNPAQLAGDEIARALVRKVTLEKTGKPNVAMN